METIFDHNPTPSELNDIRFDSLSLCQKFGIETSEKLTPELYKKLVSQENAYYDIALLFEFRDDAESANTYWKKLPESYKTVGLGYDYVIQSA